MAYCARPTSGAVPKFNRHAYRLPPRFAALRLSFSRRPRLTSCCQPTRKTMPEILIALFLLGIAVSTYVAARITLSDAVNPSVETETLRLKLHQGWLRARLQRAQAEHWDSEMTERIGAELSLVEVELSVLKPSPKAG